MARGTPLVAVAGLAGLMLVADARAADLEAGRAVVVGGKEASVTPCFMCHGLDGGGDSAGAFPRLTGQAAFYMYKQLIDYASGARPNDVMTAIARALTEAQMADVAFYYSVVDAPFAPPPAVDPDLLERGRQLAEDGLDEAGVDACNLCHGRSGTGDPPLFPYLAGQYAPYTELQLQLWQEGVRANDPLDVMAEIADALSDEDIRAVALYYEGLRPDSGESEGGARVGARARDRAGG
ncbi:MAG: cytochrome c4 [Geminicoccaceae bacterium]|nr:cytochrome c4 [Geminicoccaceae bacterium]